MNAEPNITQTSEARQQIPLADQVRMRRLVCAVLAGARTGIAPQDSGAAFWERHQQADLYTRAYREAFDDREREQLAEWERHIEEHDDLPAVPQPSGASAPSGTAGEAQEATSPTEPQPSEWKIELAKLTAPR